MIKYTAKIYMIFAQVLLLAMVLTAFTGCGNDDHNNSNTIYDDRSNSKISIGLSFDTFVVERWLKDRDIFVSTANDLGAEVNVQNANGDVSKQISQINYFIEKKVDVIVVVAVDSNAISEVLNDARDKGIKIIAYDRLIKNCHLDLYISFDNEKVGSLMGDYVLNSLPEGGNIAFIQGSKSDNNVAMVKEGVEKKFRDSQIKILYETNCENWSSNVAYNEIEKAFSLYPDINAVICGNDDLASAVYRSLSENRLANSVILVGQDADLEACQRIVSGTQLMTVYKPVEELAKSAAQCAIALASDKPLPECSTINNEYSQIPYMKLNIYPVNIGNMDTLIVKSGFHSYDEIYK